ncbi:MAG: putative aminohydrolase SsnA [Anaerolineae bacterium]|nr:putative aminohydrolase SsnA [Anaerolineae bacterium]
MLITHATLVTHAAGGIIADGALFIEGGVIRDVGASDVLIGRYPGAEQIDARGQWVMPGNVNAHTHFYGAYARGMAIPGDPPEDFPAILRRLWWNLDKALDADAVRLSAQVSLIDAIRSGTTALFDHHASPNAIEGSLDIIAAEVRRAGVRAALCYEVTDRDGQEKAEAGIAENVRFMREHRGDSQVAALFGLHASLTLGDATLRACAQANAADAGFHIHVAEHEADEADSLARSGRRVVQRLQDYGILGSRTITAHCVHVDAAETDLLQAAGGWITHQARSNMNNAVGAMAFDAMSARGMNLCLGSDGFFGSVWEEWKAAYLLHKAAHRDPRKANGGAVAAAAQRSNGLAEQVFGGRFGILEAGAHADIIFVDYHPYTPVTMGNLPWHILFGFDASMVTTTIAGGRILMRDRTLLTLDERAIAEAGRELAPAVWARYARIAEMTK